MHFKAFCIPFQAGLTKPRAFITVVHSNEGKLHTSPAKKMLLAMKLTAIILFSLAMQVSAKAFTQKVSLSVKNAQLTEVFKEIRKQTGLSFMWDEQTLRLTRPVTVDIHDGSLLQALDECIRNQPLTYSVIDNVVLIKPKNEEHIETTVTRTNADPIVKGRVTSENNEPLAGVTIEVKGKKVMSISNEDGVYAITAEAGDTLIFTYTGSIEKQVPVSNRAVIDVALQIAANDLNDVVVIGYGVQKKKDLVGSVGVASRKDFGDVTVSNTSQLIQGKIAGVQVLNNTGEPGSGSQIVVRGTGSFTDASPLYVIDGIQSDAPTFNSLSSFDIQDITVLKDASSVAIYGAQGANGVVIITTRHPKNRKPRVTYDGYTGVSKAWKQFDMLNAAQYTDLVKEWYVNYGQPLPPRLSTPEAQITKTDWQNEMFRTGKISEHHLNIGGSTDAINYSASLGYTKQEGEIVGSDYQRANFRVNLEEKIGKRFKLGQQLNVRYHITNGVPADILNGLRMPPYISVLDSTNLLGGFGIVTSALDGNDSQNPLIQPSLRDVKRRGLNNYLQLFGEVEILSGLKFRSQFGGTYNFNQNYNYNPTYAGNQLVTQSQISEAYSYGLSYILENYFTYDKTIGKHSFNVTAGNSYRNGGLYRAVNLVGSNFANSEIHQIGVAKTVSFGAGEANSASRFISYFGRINYVYNDRYILTLTGRTDATSLFSEANRIGDFPSVGLGWRVSKENFMRSIPLISDLKIRASYGKTGNSNIQGYTYQSNVWTGSGNSVVYPLGVNETLINGATVAIPSTPNLRWETTVTTDFGIDATLLNNKISLSLEYYNRDNRDLLVKVPLALSAGYGGVSGADNKQLINAASAYNRGFEITAGYSGRVGELVYNVSANAAYNKNQVQSLGTQGAVPIPGAAFYSVSAMSLTDVGHPIGAFYGYVYDHVAIDQADVDKYNSAARAKTGDPAAEYQAGLLPGDRIFKDVNGDGVVTERDQTYIGNPNPKWNYGMNLGVQFKNFDLMVALQGVAGVDLINGMKYYIEGVALPFNGKTTVLNRWKKPGDITDIARAGQNYGTSANLRNSSWFVENGAFTRIRNVTLGYTFQPEKLKSSTNNTLSSVRIYLTAQNLFTFTKYSGYDPEVSGNGDLIFNRGLDLGETPQARSVLIGLQLGF
jgi:TonB-linked SusC/RagA family outer membrane protein